MNTNLVFSLAYSPCPNDTFLFYHLVHNPILQNMKIKEILQDVENLNQAAQKSIYDFTKLSFFALFHVTDSYEILNTGSALGKGCGPILVKKKGSFISKIHHQKILIPGHLTTANLLLKIFTKNQYEPVPLRYDLILPSLMRGEYDLGVIIHEERFTYETKGFEKIVDLGEFWEDTTNLPIPLGAIAAKRNLPHSIKNQFDIGLKKSLQEAYLNPEIPKNYIKSNSQEKDDEVIQSHINLYVNNYTNDLGSEGKKAISYLYEECLKMNLFKDKKLNLFISN